MNKPVWKAKSAEMRKARQVKEKHEKEVREAKMFTMYFDNYKRLDSYKSEKLRAAIESDNYSFRNVPFKQRMGFAEDALKNELMKRIADYWDFEHYTDLKNQKETWTATINVLKRRH